MGKADIRLGDEHRFYMRRLIGDVMLIARAVATSPTRTLTHPPHLYSPIVVGQTTHPVKQPRMPHTRPRDCASRSSCAYYSLSPFHLLFSAILVDLSKILLLETPTSNFGRLAGCVIVGLVDRRAGTVSDCNAHRVLTTGSTRKGDTSSSDRGCV